MADCSHNCKTCSKECKDRTSFLVQTNAQNKIKKIIAVTSGKGGVGKSMVTSLLAVGMMKQGYKVGILDADITGPSIPYSFGVKDPIIGNELGMFPQETKEHIKIVSINLLLENQSQAVVWRGPILANAVKQFYSDVLWGEIDYLFVDMPPGTGDIALTVFQSLPINGTIIVTSPQDMVQMIVGKAVDMCNLMKVPMLGLVENMAYMVCPCCHNPVYPFGPSKIESVAENFKIPALASLPMDYHLTSLVDAGEIEKADVSGISNALAVIKKL